MRNRAAHIVVRFFSLYRACICSIEGTADLAASGAVFKHRRGRTMLRPVWVRRGIRLNEREHEQHVHGENKRGARNSGNGMDIVGTARGCWSWWEVCSRQPVRRNLVKSNLFWIARVELRPRFSTFSTPTSSSTRQSSSFSFPVEPYPYNSKDRGGPHCGMAEPLCGVCNAAPKKYKCPTCSLP